MMVKGHRVTNKTIVSLSFIICAVFWLISGKDIFGEKQYGFIFGITTAILLLTGIVGLFSKMRINSFAGMVVFSYSVSYLIYIDYVLQTEEYAQYAYLAYVAVTIIFVILIIRALSLYLGYIHNLLRMKIMLLAVLILTLICAFYQGHYHGSFFNIPDGGALRYTVDIALVIILFILLSDPVISSRSPMKRIGSDLGYLYKVAFIERDTVLLRSDVRRFVDMGRWEKSEDGLFSRTITLPLFTYEWTYLIMREWRDTGEITAQFVIDEKGSSIGGEYFKYTSYELSGDIDDCHFITMYGTNGYFIRVIILDDIVDKTKDTMGAKIKRLFYGVERKSYYDQMAQIMLEEERRK